MSLGSGIRAGEWPKKPARRGAPVVGAPGPARSTFRTFGPEETLALSEGQVNKNRAAALLDRPVIRYTPLPQALHLVAAAGTVSRQNGHGLVGGAGGAGAGFSSAFVMRNTTRATMTKSMTLPRKAP
jgi:hypothetical protein